MSSSTYVLDDKLFASNGSRFLNYILDIILLMLLLFIVLLSISIISALFGAPGLGNWLDELGDTGWRILSITGALIYYTLFEALFGRTLAKFITGTIVVDENGEKPDFGVIFKRSLCRLIPFDAFSFLGNNGRGWHDSISDTYVVRKKALDTEVKMFKELNLIGAKELN